MAIWYTQDRGLESMSTIAIETEVLRETAKRGRSKKNGSNDPTTKKEGNNMSDEVKNGTPEVETKTVQRTVFDLTSFDNMKLVKQVPVPAKPTSLENALEILNNDKEKVVNMIYEGMISEAMESAKKDIDGFKDEDGEAYTGKFATEAQGDKINAGVLALAKMQGYHKDLSAAQKKAIKERVREFIRANPAMYESM